MSGHRGVIWLIAVAYRANAFAKGSRKRVEDIHSRIEPLCKPLITALRLIQFSGFPFQYGEDGFGRGAAVYFSGERVISQVFSGLLLILF